MSHETKHPAAVARECIGKLRYAKNRSEEEVVELHYRALESVEALAGGLGVAQARIAVLENALKAKE